MSNIFTDFKSQEIQIKKLDYLPVSSCPTHAILSQLCHPERSEGSPSPGRDASQQSHDRYLHMSDNKGQPPSHPRNPQLRISLMRTPPIPRPQVDFLQFTRQNDGTWIRVCP